MSQRGSGVEEFVAVWVASRGMWCCTTRLNPGRPQSTGVAKRSWTSSNWHSTGVGGGAEQSEVSYLPNHLGRDAYWTAASASGSVKAWSYRALPTMVPAAVRLPGRGWRPHAGRPATTLPHSLPPPRRSARTPHTATAGWAGEGPIPADVGDEIARIAVGVEAGPVGVSPPTVEIRWSLILHRPVAGTLEHYVRVTDDTGASTGWDKVGDVRFTTPSRS
jgi:hypothetical protein